MNAFDTIRAFASKNEMEEYLLNQSTKLIEPVHILYYVEEERKSYCREILPPELPTELWFKALDDNCEIVFSVNEDADYIPHLQYSYDLEAWEDLENNTSVSVSKDSKIYFRGDNDYINTGDLENKFETTGSFNLGGLLSSIVNFEDNIPAWCFKSLFQNANIFDASNLLLPFEHLGEDCYTGMFQDSSLVYAPATLPSKHLADYCYFNMFRSCSNLITAPELPATQLHYRCYGMMFRDSNLSVMPNLPATTLVEQCYEKMFLGSNLQKADKLAATTLAPRCMDNMFGNCKNLNYVKVHFSDWMDDDEATIGWLTGDGSESENPNVGLFEIVDENLEIVTDTSHIPENWIYNIREDIDTSTESITYSGTNYIKLTPSEATIFALLNKNNTPNVYISTDAETYYQYDGSYGLRGNIPVYIIGDNLDGFNHGERYYSKFMLVGNGTTVLEGNIMSLLDYSDLSLDEIPCDYCFYKLFEGTNITTAPELPAANLTEGCYNYLFNGCTHLNHVSVNFTDWNLSCTESWLKGVSQTGTFECPSDLYKILGYSRMPKEWNIVGGREFDTDLAVDLDLPSGIMWMPMNIGAQSEEEYGDYFQFGATTGYTGQAAKDHSYWRTCPFNNGSDDYDAEYFSSVRDSVCPSDVLSREYDAVYQQTSGSCRMASRDQIDELARETDNIWTTINGTNGRKFMSKKDHNKYIFIPASGCYNFGGFSNEGSGGCVWSSALDGSGPNNACYLSFNGDYCNVNSDDRCNAFAVRGVI